MKDNTSVERPQLPRHGIGRPLQTQSADGRPIILPTISSIIDITAGQRPC